MLLRFLLWRMPGLRIERLTTLGVRGIRVEDDVLITEAGARILGPPIARTRADVEQVMAGGAAPS